MPSKLIGVYNVDYSAVALPDGEGWAAHLTISGPSSNPMHRHIVFPEQRVSSDKAFATESEAEQEALRVAEGMVNAAHDAPPHD